MRPQAPRDPNFDPQPKLATLYRLFSWEPASDWDPASSISSKAVSVHQPEVSARFRWQDGALETLAPPKGPRFGELMGDGGEADLEMSNQVTS